MTNAITITAKYASPLCDGTKGWTVFYMVGGSPNWCVCLGALPEEAQAAIASYKAQRALHKDWRYADYATRGEEPTRPSLVVLRVTGERVDDPWYGPNTIKVQSVEVV